VDEPPTPVAPEGIGCHVQSNDAALYEGTRILLLHAATQLAILS
jgi:hypothetical protein